MSLYPFRPALGLNRRENLKSLTNIIIGYITVDEEIPEHDDDHSNCQGDVFGKEIWAEDRHPKWQCVEYPQHDRLYEFQDWHPDDQAHHADDRKGCKLL